MVLPSLVLDSPSGISTRLVSSLGLEGVAVTGREPAPGDGVLRRVDPPVDLGQEASWRKALPFAIDLAQRYGASLHVMTVVPDHGFHYVSQFFPEGYEEKMLQDADERLHALVRERVPADLDVQHIVAHGTIYREIVAAASRIAADAIVMASHTPDVADVIIGPNAERVLHHFPRSVLIVRE